ncbi:MAG: hypothetical protein KDA78_17090, partial [Planctomycetaceae bacterium]|nr:hypothetical protein [Planctomycetaceae bacterium]
MKYSLKLCVLLCGIILMPHQARSQPDQKIAGKESLAKQAALLDPLLKGATALNPQKTLYLDSNTKSVWLRAHVVLQEGILEMLCCPDQTKEHESILATNCSGQAIHTALLAIGAEPGSPVEFTPEFTPPRGEELAITLHWAEPNGKLKKEEATEWIRTTTRRYFIARLPELPKDLVIPEDYELRYDAQNGELLHFGELTPAYLEQYQKL